MSDYLFSNRLCHWYSIHKRDLPWRNTHNPYHIWISEIILQQTRVDQGLEYYLRFIRRFPDINSLAKADLDEVLKLWQGLGYYSRARNLHHAAQTVTYEMGAQFPCSYKEIISLKGIGEYTAAAISSFAFNLPHAVVDGNVFRVLSRIFNEKSPINTSIGKKRFALLAAEVLDPAYAYEHNQAIMEFGALQCTPSSPDCLNCIMNDLCLSYQKNEVNQLPVKIGKTKVRERWFNYVSILHNGKTWIHQRMSKDIWHQLYEFPLIETANELTFEEFVTSDEFKNLIGHETKFAIEPIFLNKKHLLSHQKIHANIYKVQLIEPFINSNQYVEINIENIDDFAVPQLLYLALEHIYQK